MLDSNYKASGDAINVNVEKDFTTGFVGFKRFRS